MAPWTAACSYRYGWAGTCLSYNLTFRTFRKERKAGPRQYESETSWRRADRCCRDEEFPNPLRMKRVPCLCCCRLTLRQRCPQLQAYLFSPAPFNLDAWHFLSAHWLPCGEVAEYIDYVTVLCGQESRKNKSSELSNLNFYFFIFFFFK